MAGPIIGYVPGVFDLFHIGHLTILRRAREQCDVLVAGIVSDAVCEQTKGFRPTVPFEERIAIVDALRIVDATYGELTPDKRDAHAQVGFHRLFKGDDWLDTGKGLDLERRMAPLGVEVVYLPYSPQTSSTARRLEIARGAVS
jgi:glycerol-3-phosphate cytidylyltransferase